MSRRFTISEREEEVVRMWDDPKSGHKCTAELETFRSGYVSKKSGATGGHLSYIFIPTGIGTITKVRCGHCGAILDLTDYDRF